MGKVQLKPCPCCGSNRVGILKGKFIQSTAEFRAGQSTTKVWCKSCQLRTGPEKSQRAAIAVWNRRKLVG